MTVTDVTKDTRALTMTITATYPVPPERLWQVWADPRQLERWWGPPTFPATFVDHDLTPGGLVTYFMTSPEGEEFHGWWRVRRTDPPHRLEVEDGFADADGVPSSTMPTTEMTMTIEGDAQGSTMVIRSTFPSTEAMEQLVEMGMEEGMGQALGQIDGILAS